jgi:hypothetical protein
MSGGAVDTSLGIVLVLDIVKVNEVVDDSGCSSEALIVKVYVPISTGEVEVISSVSAGDQEIIPPGIVTAGLAAPPPLPTNE